jgi:hypothetical protein
MTTSEQIISELSQKVIKAIDGSAYNPKGVNPIIVRQIANTILGQGEYGKFVFNAIEKGIISSRADLLSSVIDNVMKLTSEKGFNQSLEFSSIALTNKNRETINFLQSIDKEKGKGLDSTNPTSKAIDNVWYRPSVQNLLSSDEDASLHKLLKNLAMGFIPQLPYISDYKYLAALALSIFEEIDLSITKKQEFAVLFGIYPATNISKRIPLIFVSGTTESIGAITYVLEDIQKQIRVDAEIITDQYLTSSNASRLQRNKNGFFNAN